jgi:hypothetical protein
VPVAVLPTAKSLSAFSLKPQSDRLLAFAIPGAISIIAKAIHRSSALSQRTGMNCALAGAPAAIFKPAR